MAIVEEKGIDLSAFVWTHAQAEKDLATQIEAAKRGAWVSLDGFREKRTAQYLEMIRNLKANDCLDRVLISHDAGWYRPEEENGGADRFRGYTAIFQYLVPALQSEGFRKREINRLLVENPKEAFTIRVRRS